MGAGALWELEPRDSGSRFMHSATVLQLPLSAREDETSGNFQMEKLKWKLFESS